MSWNDAAQLESRLNRALETFNWPEAEAICTEIIDRINTDPELLPENSAKRLMQSLRGKRRFQLMTRLAEALLQSGLRTPQLRRQYAQALIDQGILAAAEMVLQSIIQDPQVTKGEESEARGLTGRIYKQLYVNNNDPNSERNRANLERAIAEYLHVYRLDPQSYLWHGINVVALVNRAQRDQIPLAGLPETSVLAQDILKTLEQRENEAIVPFLPAYDMATRMEAYVALGHNQGLTAAAKYYEDAAGTALRYIDSADANAFEIYSTLRQLTEVWQLSETEPPGDRLLPILRAGHLRKEGAATVRNPQKLIEESAIVGAAVTDLEKVFGPDRMVTLKWYKKGLEQCNSVARIERRNGKGYGTGWLVNASDFFPGREGKLLLTCNHVVGAPGSPPHPKAIFPDDAQVNFQALGEVFDVEDDVVFTSPVGELDATFLVLKGDPTAEPFRLHKRAMEMTEPPPRLYIIGHPAGRDLEISLQDNHLLASTENLLHYRTPTEPGSSGSPVFEPEDWRVVALHHSGSQEMSRLDGQAGTYQANEGIAILALQKATRTA